MAKVETEAVDVHEASLDNSDDGEYLGMVDEGSYDSTEGKPHIVTQSYLDSNDNNSYNYKELSGGVAYKLIPMTGEDTGSNMPHSPNHDTSYFVISNPMEVFSAQPSPKKPARREQMQMKAVTAKKRDDKRRATHNEVERRRRDKINSWITKLANLIPNSGLPDSSSKGGILAKACDHINELTEKQQRLEKLEVENGKLVLEVLRLNQELSEVRKENSTMRNQLADSCIAGSRSKGQKS